MARIGDQGRDVGMIGLQFQFAGLDFIDFDDNHPHAHAVERTDQPAAGLAVATDQEKGFLQAPDRAREALDTQGVAKVLVLEKAEQRADRICPADHRHVDAHRRPHPLLFAEGVGHLAKTDRGGGVADEVEGMKETHPRRIAVLVEARDDSEPEHRDCKNDDQQDQRRTHAPQHQEKGAVMRARYHRRCMMVSAIRMITETTLANSAPPESETIFEVRSADRAAPATVVP